MQHKRVPRNNSHRDTMQRKPQMHTDGKGFSPARSNPNPASFLSLLFVTLALLGLSGCMADNPNETDMPWAAPASWEGTMPLPGGYMDRYQ